LIHDRDARFIRSFDDVFCSEGAEVLLTPVQAPNANAYAERWIRTVRAECLDWLLITGRGHLERVLHIYIEHYNGPPALYRLPPGGRPDAHLDAWLARASRCRIPAMLDLSRTIRRHRDQILAAVQLGLSNSKLEGLNSKIRLINHRGYGHHSAPAVIAMIYLCCSGLTITLPTGR
jgi:hypothetical protein